MARAQDQPQCTRGKPRGTSPRVVPAGPASPEHERHYRQVVEHSPIGMALATPDEGWIEVNPVLCGILGRSVEELRALTMSDVVHPDDAPLGSAARRRLLAGEIGLLETEERYLRPDGVVVCVSLTVGLWRDETGRPLYFVLQVQDRPQRRAQWAALERERDEALRSNRELEQFASIASHDLSEPLRTIAGLMDLLAQDYGERLDAAAAEYMTFVITAACRMQAMVDGLLASARIGPEVRVEPVNVALVLEDVCEALGRRFGETGGALAVVDTLPTLRADPVRMHQLLLNVVANAFEVPSARSISLDRGRRRGPRGALGAHGVRQWHRCRRPGPRRGLSDVPPPAPRR